VSRTDVIRNAYQRYLHREITLAQLLATVAQWRPKR
jgi:hypothetical protein